MTRPMAGPKRLDAVHRIVIEEPRAARPALEVPESRDHETVSQSAVFDDPGHLDRPALGAGQRLRHQCCIC